ncbi:ligand-binding sensor domain-containing protein [Pontiella sulfatireligans]|uniref:histidine kinase n=1 Tax=Pontiella sulfatireligans TaxID=2750658 RepID=A0A6C2UWL4_9BACT|nr:sensor histidine kinase [Pontiella sulfatireligans]VGO23236.1 Sensor histidine kinase LiaS [Pontiella sulfatireligans]
MIFLRFSRFCLIGLLFICAAITSDAVESEIVSLGDQTFQIRTWQVGEGLPSNQVRDVLQTRDGFIWVATLNGAARFDGVEFIHYSVRSAPALANNRIAKLFEDASGNLFMGHETGHISVLSESGIIGLACPKDWLGAEVVDFHEKPDGSVWAENVNGTFLPLSDPLSSNEGVGSFEKTLSGWRVDNNRVIKLNVDGVEENIVPRPWLIKEQEIELLERRNGDLVAGSTYGGIFIMHGGSSNVTQITVNDGLASIEVLCLAEDAEQTLWVGTAAGLQSIRAMGYTSVPEALFRSVGWHFRAFRSITPRLAGGVWLGTSKGFLYSSDGKGLKRVPNLTKSEEVRRAVLETPEGTVWANNNGGFLLRKDGNEFHEVKAVRRGVDKIWTLHQAADGGLWAGGREGIWSNPDNKGWNLKVGRREGITDVQCLTSGPDGTLWVGMESGGLASWKNDQLVRGILAEDLPNAHVTALCVDKDDDSLWIGFYGSGLALFRDGVFLPVLFAQEMISHITDDGEGRLWVVGEHGIAIIEKSEVERSFSTGQPIETYALYNKEDGLNPAIDISAGLSTACRTPDGRFWYASDRQLSVFQPSEIQLWTNPVPLVINSVRVNDRVIHLQNTDSMILDPGVHRLDIRFSALSFISPNRMRFRCRMVGLGEEWIELDTRRVASYQRIPPGNYRFELTAANRDGIWNHSPIVLNVVVNPYIRETWWFKTVLYLLIGVLATFISLAIADRVNRKKLIRAEQRRAVEEERTRISMDIHDEIGSELTRLQLLCYRVSMLFNKSGNEAGQDTVVEINHVTDKLVQAFDETVWVVSPGNDNMDNLVGYLSKYVAQYLRATNISCDLNVPLNLPNLPVLSPVRHNLFLAIKEALNNAVKHAEATQISFTVFAEGQVLKLALHDNGKGVQVQEAERFHRGLRSMRRRMKLIGGTFNIHNNEEGGATAEFIVPIREDVE